MTGRSIGGVEGLKPKRRIGRAPKKAIGVRGGEFYMRDKGSFELLYEDEVVGFSESEEEGRASSANVGADGTVTSRVQGTPTEGEEDTLRAAQALYEKFNEDGDNWAPPERGPVGTADDFILRRRNDRFEQLMGQVVRAVVDQDFYRALRGQERHEETSANLADLAQRLRKAIASKSNDTRLAPDVRKNLVLVIDATRISALALPRVAMAFKASYREWVVQQGFKEVWLVGPTIRMTSRLDK
jgi:hypothetical protein